MLWPPSPGSGWTLGSQGDLDTSPPLLPTSAAPQHPDSAPPVSLGVSGLRTNPRVLSPDLTSCVTRGKSPPPSFPYLPTGGGGAVMAASSLPGSRVPTPPYWVAARPVCWPKVTRAQVLSAPHMLYRWRTLLPTHQEGLSGLWPHLTQDLTWRRCPHSQRAGWAGVTPAGSA